MSSSRHILHLGTLHGLAIAAGMILGVDAHAQEQSTAAAPLPSYMKQRDGRADPAAIKTSEAMWTLFSAVSALEAQRPTQGRILLLERGAGLDTATADKVVAHIAAVTGEHRAYAKSMLANNCQELRDAALTTEELAAKLAQAEALERQHREASFAQLSKVLTPADRQRLDDWVETNMRSSMQVIDVDYKSLLTEGGVDRGMLIARMCERAQK